RFTAPEEKMVARLDRTAVKFWTLLSLAGVLESVPDFNQRQLRLADRKFQWIKVALPNNKEQKLEQIKNSLRSMAKKLRRLETLREERKVSEAQHLANFECLAGHASELRARMH